MLVIKGFITIQRLTQHLVDHSTEFDATTEQEYLSLAVLFLGCPRDSNTLECVRNKQNNLSSDIVRYNTITQEFGVLRNDGYIRTYFKPDRSQHPQGTNLNYFQWACGQ